TTMLPCRCFGPSKPIRPFRVRATCCSRTAGIGRCEITLRRLLRSSWTFWPKSVLETGMNDLSERTLLRSGSTIHYWVGGPEGRPLVTLTHGATMDHRMFDAQIPALADSYRVLICDVRGHGRSQPLGINFSIAAAAEDLLA